MRSGVLSSNGTRRRHQRPWRPVCGQRNRKDSVFQFQTNGSSGTARTLQVTTMDTRTVPTTPAKSAQFRRVRRAALWFNKMWPGSLSQEANGHWLTHGPEGRYRLRWRTTFVRAWMMASFAPAAWAPNRWGHTCPRRAVIWAWLPLGAGIASAPGRFGAEPLGRRRMQRGAIAAVIIGFAALALPSAIGHHNGSREGWRAALLHGILGDDSGPKASGKTHELASYKAPRSTVGRGSSSGGANSVEFPGPDLAGSDDGALVPIEGTIPLSPPGGPLFGGDGPQDGLTFLGDDFAGDLGGGPGSNGGGGGSGGGSGTGGGSGGSVGGGSGGGAGVGGNSGGSSGGSSGGGSSAGGSTGGGSGGSAGGGPGNASGGGPGIPGGGLGGASQIIPLGALPDDHLPPSGGGGSGGTGGGSGTGGSGTGGSGGPPPPGSAPKGGPNGGPSGGPNGGGPTTGPGGGPTTPIPEPAVWVSLISGFGLMGALLRRRRATMAGQVAG
jgi:hypothetical protein